jgi:hypothetical protein
MKCRKWVHNGSHTIWKTFRCGNAWKLPDCIWIIMHLNWRDNQEKSFTKGHHTHGNFYRSQAKWRSCWLLPKLQRLSSDTCCPPGTVVNTVIMRTSWNTISTLHCIVSDYIFCSQALLCCMITLRVMLPRQWLICSVELGGTGKYTIFARHEPMWLWPLLETERTRIRHLIQDEETGYNNGRMGCHRHNENGHCQWHKMPCRGVVTHLWHGRRIYWRLVKYQLWTMIF